MDEIAIFTTALQQPTFAAREAYLATVCAEDEVLRRRIAALLVAHERADGLLESSLLLPDSTLSDLQPGSCIGNYRLLEELGAGGFGVVYLAEQSEPVQRRVALKVIKLGMDTRQIVARFQAEQQVLAIMEHPHIARVLDAGTTDTGRPFFVMEYVAGKPMTQFCNDSTMSISARMELFATLCRAIHHAHQKGIIHRDIKPSNVLVTQSEDGDNPTVKVIDFGIAKALQPTADSDRRLTRDQQLLGTPAYMSPEQAAGRHDQVDTRSDVYALGALAYELLVGQPPFDEAVDRLSSASDEATADREPISPSQRISRLNNIATAVQRSTDPKKLRSEVRGDLDWIVLTALAKERELRYQSALSLAEDVERYLRDDPIEARPPSTLYRCRKFVRRHRAAIVLTLAPFLMLATFGITHWITSRSFVAENERRVALSRHRIELELNDAYQWFDPLRNRSTKNADDIGKSLESARRAEALLQSAEADTVLVARVHRLLATLEREQGDLRFLEQMSDSRLGFPGSSTVAPAEGLDHFERAFAALGIEPQQGDSASAALLLQDRPKEVLQMAVAALDLWAISLPDTQTPRREWLQATAKLADPDPWRTRLRDAIEQRDVELLAQLAADEQLERQPPPTLMVLATVLQQYQHPSAFLVLRRAADAHPDVYVFNAIVGNTYSRQGNSTMDAEAIQRAMRHLSSALAVRPDDVRILNTLATNLSRVGEHADAVAMLTRAVERQPSFWFSWQNLSLALARQGDFEQALDLSQQSILRMHDAGQLPNLQGIMRQTLHRIELCVQIAASTPVEIQSGWQYLDGPPADWMSHTTDDLPFSASTPPWGTSLFRRATAWHTPTLLVSCRPDTLEALGDLEQNQVTYLFVVSSLARGEIFVNERHAGAFIDSGGDPQAVVCRPEAIAALRAEGNRVRIYAHRTKPEAFLAVQIRHLDVAQARQRTREVVATLRSQLSQSVDSTADSGSGVTDAQERVRAAFESEVRTMSCFVE